MCGLVESGAARRSASTRLRDSLMKWICVSIREYARHTCECSLKREEMILFSHSRQSVSPILDDASPATVALRSTLCQRGEAGSLRLSPLKEVCAGGGDEGNGEGEEDGEAEEEGGEGVGEGLRPAAAVTSVISLTSARSHWRWARTALAVRLKKAILWRGEF